MSSDRVQAKSLNRGMTFELSETECFVVKAQKNQFGMTVIHFVMDPNTYTDISMLIVPSNFEFCRKNI